MSYTAINVRVSRDEKQAFEDFCQNAGMNVSVAINMFIKAVLGEGRIPFVIRDHTPNAQTRKTLDGILDGTEPLSREFSSVDDMMKDILND